MSERYKIQDNDKRADVHAPFERDNLYSASGSAVTPYQLSFMYSKAIEPLTPRPLLLDAPDFNTVEVRMSENQLSVIGYYASGRISTVSSGNWNWVRSDGTAGNQRGVSLINTVYLKGTKIKNSDKNSSIIFQNKRITKSASQ